MDFGSIDERSKRDPVFVDGIHVRHRECLVPPGVGEHRAVPFHKPMGASESFEEFGPGTEHEVIGVVENDLRPDAFHLLGEDALHGGGGRDRHERRRRETAMWRLNGSSPRVIRGALGLDRELDRAGHRLEASRRIFFSLDVRLWSPFSWILLRIRSISTSATVPPPALRTFPAR